MSGDIKTQLWFEDESGNRTPVERPTPPPFSMKQDTFNLTEGVVVLQWPGPLSKASFEDLESWLHLELRKIKRGIATPRRSQKEVYVADEVIPPDEQPIERST